ncbi:MAG: MBL fold metallo-hydrolase [Sphingomonadaceae bacterium]|nr:MBL fold metallo-hydrolase [Sphingomonadaceae bacterium]
MKVRILGCGTSSGVPRIGNDWGACDPAEAKNRRRRASVLVEHRGTRILVDTSPDLREQLLDADVATLDAVIWTHDHADHCHGIDDLRQVFHAMERPVAGYARPRTLASLQKRFGYAFEGNGGYPATIEGDGLPDRFEVGLVTIRVVDQPHGGITSAGLRFDAGGANVGYSTDCDALTGEMADLFAGLDLWIVDALRARPHPTHANLDQALCWIARLRPKRAVLTHMDQSMDYAALAASLPKGVEPGFDGMEIAL